MSCRFNPSGNLLAAGLLNGTIKVYTVTDGSCVHTLQDKSVGYFKPSCHFTSVCPHRRASQRDLLLATYAGGEVRFWHVPTQSCIRSLHEDRQTFVAALNPSGSHFLTAGSSDSIYVYDTETGERLSVCQPSPSLSVMDGHRSRIFALTFDPSNEEAFLSGGWDDTVQFWSIRERHSLRKISGPHVCGDAIDIDPKTNQILIGSWRRQESLEVWDSLTGRKVQTVPTDCRGPCSVYSCGWLGSGHMIAAGSDLNMCRIIDHKSLTTLGCLVDLPGGVYSMDVSSSGPAAAPLIALTSSHSIFLLRPSLGVNLSRRQSGALDASRKENLV
uniref:Uncharacterized protein n=1 Tax=Leptobrachium leishanense TaxID=445787 RepID=A0A8C5QPW3_9ANUR